MYTPNQTKQLQQETTELLKGSQLTLTDVDKLRRVLRFHEYRYYVLDEPLIADAEYDRLYKSLEIIEAAHPECITPGSPTQRVGSSLNPSFVTVPHIVPMLSLANSYNEEDLIDWDRKAREATGLDK